ncbi:hypothetical protein ABPG74_006701 [Tetrahymena malaccensis]
MKNSSYNQQFEALEQKFYRLDDSQYFKRSEYITDAKNMNIIKSQQEKNVYISIFNRMTLKSISFNLNMIFTGIKIYLTTHIDFKFIDLVIDFFSLITQQQPVLDCNL